MAAVSDNTRSWLFHLTHLDSYKTFAYQANERKFLEDVNIRRLTAAYLDDAAPLPSSLGVKEITGSRGYPSLDNLKTVFLRMGAVELKPYLDKKLKFNSVLYLQSISDSRATVAHKFSPPLARGDVLEYSKKVQQLAMWLDHAMFSTVVKSCDSGLWDSLC